MTKASARTVELLKSFGSRISKTPFTLDGIPSDDEVKLTKDIWGSLTATEKIKICDNIRRDFQRIYGDLKETPDPTPYAMRLTHRYLDIMNAEVGASAG